MANDYLDEKLGPPLLIVNGVPQTPRRTRIELVVEGGGDIDCEDDPEADDGEGRKIITITAGDGGEGSVVPLSNTLFVDGGTAVAVPDQDGSIGAPFSTLTAAVAAAAGNSRTIVITPGNYSAESTITWAAAERLKIVCLSGMVPVSGFEGGTDPDPDGSAKLPSISATAEAGSVHVAGCWWDAKTISASDDDATLRLDACSLINGCTISGFANVDLARSSVNGTISADSVVRASLCQFAVSAINVGSSGIVEAMSCQFTGTVGITFTGGAGTFRVDPVSNYYWELATETLTNGAKVVIGLDGLATVSPAQITSNQNNYTATGLGAADIWRASTDAARTLTGIDAAAFSPRQRKTLINVGSSDLVLAHQNAGSSAANRIIVPTGLDLTLGPDDSVDLWYDPTTGRVRVL